MKLVSDLNFEQHFQEWYKKSFCIYLYRRVFVSFIVNNSLVNDEQNYKSFFDEQFQKYYMLLRIVFKLVLPDGSGFRRQGTNWKKFKANNFRLILMWKMKWARDLKILRIGWNLINKNVKTVKWRNNILNSLLVKVRT